MSWRPAMVTAGLVVIMAGPGLAGMMAGCSPAVAPAPAPAGFANPVWDGNFPDPMVISGPDGTAYAFATNGNTSNVQTLTSRDLVAWESSDDALPRLARWSTPGKVWAPEVSVHGPTRYVMYYTTRAPNPSLQCIGIAVSRRPGGPYVDSSTRPLVCETEAGGSIDASPFTASDGTRYLYWKNDGNAVGVDTYLSVARLSPDGTRLVGRPQRLFKQDLPWEGQLVEAPFVWEDDGLFHLFYSANAFASADYAVGHAVATSPTGPFTKTPEPVLVSNEVAAGPGHCALFERDGRVWMTYHAWAPEAVGEEFPGRSMWLSEVTFAGRTVRVTPPSTAHPTRP